MTTSEKAYDEIIDLFAQGTTPRTILQFHPSERAQDRVRRLLQRLKNGTLTPEETSELDRLGQLEHFMQLVKARARAYEDHSQ